MKTNFENIGGSYSQQGDYLLPSLTLPDENQRQISVWAMRHRRYLKSSHRVLYYNLLHRVSFTITLPMLSVRQRICLNRQ